MTTRKDIIKTLKTDMEDSIKSSNGYNTDPFEFKLGIISYDEVVQKPSLGYWAFQDTKNEEYLDDQRHRLLSIIVYGYANSDGLDGFDAIYDFAEDVETFLMSDDWTYTDCTLLGDIVITVGGTNNDKCMFDLIIEVDYVQEF